MDFPAAPVAEEPPPPAVEEEAPAPEPEPAEDAEEAPADDPPAPAAEDEEEAEPAAEAQAPTARTPAAVAPAIQQVVDGEYGPMSRELVARIRKVKNGERRMPSEERVLCLLALSSCAPSSSPFRPPSDPPLFGR